MFYSVNIHKSQIGFFYPFNKFVHASLEWPILHLQNKITQISVHSHHQVLLYSQVALQWLKTP